MWRQYPASDLSGHYAKWRLKLRATESGTLIGVASNQEGAYTCKLIRSAGQRVDYCSFRTMGHRLHSLDPQLLAQTLVDWASSLLDRGRQQTDMNRK
jgi:hypothetical protein